MCLHEQKRNFSLLDVAAQAELLDVAAQVEVREPYTGDGDLRTEDPPIETSEDERPAVRPFGGLDSDGSDSEASTEPSDVDFAREAAARITADIAKVGGPHPD